MYCTSCAKEIKQKDLVKTKIRAYDIGSFCCDECVISVVHGKINQLTGEINRLKKYLNNQYYRRKINEKNENII